MPTLDMLPKRIFQERTLAYQLKLRIRQFAASKAATFLLYFVFFWITAAATHSGFIGKWALRDNSSEGFSIEKVLDGTAAQPVIYRRLLPLIANMAEEYTPGRIKSVINHYALKPEKVFTRATTASDPKYRFRYIIIYYINFMSILTSLFILNTILRRWKINELTALLAPIIFALSTPYLQTRGGYYYDGSELFFLSLAFLVASSGNVLLLIALTPPATLNKETFLLFLPTLYPLVRQRHDTRVTTYYIFLSTLVSGITGLALKYIFRDSPGTTAYLRVWDQFYFYIDPRNYIMKEMTYGVVGPRYLFFGTLIFFVIVVLRGWSACSVVIQRHILIAAAINIPVCLFVGAPGELRNLSLLYVGFVFLLSYAIPSTSIASKRAPQGTAASSKRVEISPACITAHQVRE